MSPPMRHRTSLPNANPLMNLPPGRRGYNTPPPGYVMRNRTAEIITISILVAGFFLLGLGVMLWAIQSQTIALGPTPTPTPTAGVRPTTTPDFRATRVVADFLTQQAYQIAQSGTPLPTLPITLEPAATLPGQLPSDALVTPGNELYVPIPGAPTPTDDNSLYVPVPGPGNITPETGSPTPTETPQSSVRLPILAAEPLGTPTSDAIQIPPDQPADATPTPELPTATLVPPTPTLEPPTLTPTLEMPTQAPPTLEPPTVTPTLPPPTPSPTASATGEPVIVGSLRGYVRGQDTSVFIGPSILYTQTGTLAANAEIRMLGRSVSGEWVYVCCIEDNEPVWVRHAYVKPRDNPVPPGVPEETNPDDIRFLNVQPAPSGLVRIPVPTPPPDNVFPLARYDRAARGLLPSLPQFPLELAWPGVAQAGQGFVSPVIVTLNGVLAASADNHLYSFDRVNGNQRWRYNVGQLIRIAPLLYDNEIFVADETGRVRAFEDRGNEAVEIWNNTYGQPPITSFNVFSDTLYLGIGQAANHTLVAIDRDNGAELRRINFTGPVLRYPAIGDQLIYVADNTLVALDVFTFEQVWERGDITQAELVSLQTAPVYDAPGVQAQAELFIVDGNSRVWALDANTGDTLWTFDNGEVATSLALTPRVLIVAGNGYLKAISRDDNSELWRAPMVGTVLGGPLTDGSLVMAVTQGGNIQYFDVSTGDTRSSAIPAPAGGAAAVGGQWLYVPGTDGQMYAVRGTTP